MKDSGLVPDSAPFNYEDLEEKIDYGRQLGLKYMVCSILPKNLWDSPEGFKEAAAANLNNWGKRVRDAGMQLAFHNHNCAGNPSALLDQDETKLPIFESMKVNFDYLNGREADLAYARRRRKNVSTSTHWVG